MKGSSIRLPFSMFEEKLSQRAIVSNIVELEVSVKIVTCLTSLNFKKLRNFHSDPKLTKLNGLYVHSAFHKAPCLACESLACSLFLLPLSSFPRRRESRKYKNSFGCYSILVPSKYFSKEGLKIAD